MASQTPASSQTVSEAVSSLGAGCALVCVAGRQSRAEAVHAVQATGASALLVSEGSVAAPLGANISSWRRGGLLAARAVDVRQAVLSRKGALEGARLRIAESKCIVFEGVECVSLLADGKKDRRVVVLLTDAGRAASVAEWLTEVRGFATVNTWAEPKPSHVELYLQQPALSPVTVTRYDGAVDSAAVARLTEQKEKLAPEADLATLMLALAAMRTRDSTDVIVVYSRTARCCERRAVALAKQLCEPADAPLRDFATALDKFHHLEAGATALLRCGVGLCHSALTEDTRTATELAARSGLVRVVCAVSRPAFAFSRAIAACRPPHAVSTAGAYLTSLVDGRGRLEVVQWTAEADDDLVEGDEEMALLDSKVIDVLPMMSYGLLFALRAASSDLRALLELSLEHYELSQLKLPAAKKRRRKQHSSCRGPLREMTRRRSNCAPWLQPGRVAQIIGGPWAVVLSLPGNARTEVVDVLVDNDPPIGRPSIERIGIFRLRLTSLRVFLGSAELKRPEQKNAVVRSLRDALSSSSSSSKEQENKKRSAPMLDDLGVIELRGADARTAERLRAHDEEDDSDSDDDDSAESSESSQLDRLRGFGGRAKVAKGALRKLGLATKKGELTDLGTATAECVFALDDERRALVLARVAPMLAALQPAVVVAALVAIATVSKGSAPPADLVAVVSALRDAAFDVAEACGDDARLAFEFAESFSGDLAAAAYTYFSTDTTLASGIMLEGELSSALRRAAPYATQLGLLSDEKSPAAAVLLLHSKPPLSAPSLADHYPWLDPPPSSSS